MNPKNTLLLALLLVVLAAGATLVEWNKRRTRSPKGDFLFPAFSVEKADLIEVKGKGQDVRLEKANSRWTVATEEGYAADPKHTGDILAKVREFRASDIISESREKQTSFGVDSTGIEVKISAAGKTTADFWVGKNGPDYLSSYIRPAGKDAVYRVPANLGMLVDRNGETWRNKVVLEVDKEEIKGWTTRTGKETVTVAKSDDGTWAIKEPIQAKARPDIANMVLGQLGVIKATAFADSVAGRLGTVGLEPDTCSVEVQMADGTTHKILVGATTSRNQSYTMVAGDPVVYLVPRGRWNTIIRPSDYLKAEEGADAPEVTVGTK